MRVLLAFALLAYPAVVYFLADRAGPVATACVFALVAGGRLLLAKNLTRRALTMGLAAVVLLCLLTAALQSVVAVKFYPVVISAAAAIWCAYTLLTPPSAIERLLNAANESRAGLPKRLRERIPLGADGESGLAPSRVQLNYMRSLTGVWCAFFGLNAVLAAYTALAMSTGAWALYNGCISYLLIGLLLLAEMGYRSVYQRRHPEHESAGIPAAMAVHTINYKITPTQECETLFQDPDSLNEGGPRPVTADCWQALHRASFEHQIAAKANPAWWIDFKQDDQATRALAFVDHSLPCFIGHFPEQPILPGVIQLQWAIELAEALWPAELPAHNFAGLARLKFKAPIKPGAMIAVQLARSASGATLSIANHSEVLTSAQLLYRD